MTRQIELEKELKRRERLTIEEKWILLDIKEAELKGITETNAKWLKEIDERIKLCAEASEKVPVFQNIKLELEEFKTEMQETAEVRKGDKV